MSLSERGIPQEALRDRIEQAIDYSITEWHLTYYDVVGVLNCAIHDLQHDSIDRNKEEEGD